MHAAPLTPRPPSLHAHTGRQRSAGPRKDPPIQNALNLTLEELFTGATKKMKISRNIQGKVSNLLGCMRVCAEWDDGAREFLGGVRPLRERVSPLSNSARLLPFLFCSQPASEILEVDIKAGWKKGTKVTFQEKGACGAHQDCLS